MLNLIAQIFRFLFFGIVPTQQGREAIRITTHTAFVLCPIISLLFMIAVGLHFGWVGGYAIAAFLALIPVVLMELYRRLARVIPFVGDRLSEFVSTLATPHTWLAITCFWLILLQPSSPYRSLVYLVAFGAILWIVVGGRWHQEPAWYRPLTLVSLFLPIFISVGILIFNAVYPDDDGIIAQFVNRNWPHWYAGYRNRATIDEEESAKNHYGQRFDQQIWTVTEPAFAIVPGRPRTGWWIFGSAAVPDREVLMFDKESVWKVPNGGRRVLRARGIWYAEYYRAAATGVFMPNEHNIVWLPESLVRSGADYAFRDHILPKDTKFRLHNPAENLPRTTGNLFSYNYRVKVKVTKREANVRGFSYTMCLLQDAGMQGHIIWALTDSTVTPQARPTAASTTAMPAPSLATIGPTSVGPIRVGDRIELEEHCTYYKPDPTAGAHQLWWFMKDQSGQNWKATVRAFQSFGPFTYAAIQLDGRSEHYWIDPNAGMFRRI